MLLSRVMRPVIRPVARIGRALTGQKAGAVLAAMEALPVAPLRAILGDRPPLIVSPHPDDESLGCGGLIAEACAEGLPPFVAMLTDGGASHPNSRTHPRPVLVALRAEETRAALATLGLPHDRIAFLGQPDGAAPRRGPAMEEAAARIAALAHGAGCGSILASWEHDPHPDHAAACAIGRRAAALLGVPLLRYVVWGWTLPADAVLPRGAPRGFRLEMGRHLGAKRRAIAAHASQYGDIIRDDPQGFRLPARLLAALDRPFEVVLTEP